MRDKHVLFPPPAVIRERLAENYKEAELLRRQLRVSQDAEVVVANRQARPEIFRKEERP
jgi:hypothetical protein